MGLGELAQVTCQASNCFLQGRVAGNLWEDQGTGAWRESWAVCVAISDTCELALWHVWVMLRCSRDV